MATAPSTILAHFAESLLRAGQDRIAYRFDRRREDVLRRSGLLTYPDGTYSLTEDAMESAVSWWRTIVKTETRGNPARMLELQSLVEQGESWLSAYRVPDIQKLRFGDLAYLQYKTLWVLVTDWANSHWLDLPSTTKKEKEVWTILAKKGYVTSTVIGNTEAIVPTAKGKGLVATLGSPSLKTAARVVERYAAVITQRELHEPQPEDPDPHRRKA